MKPPRVLISAYACEPGKGSEPGTGWNTALALSEFCEVTVLTRANNKEAIEKELAGLEGPVPRFEFYDLPRWARFLKGRKLLPVYVYYLWWQSGAYRSMREKLNAANFDLVHHLTFNSFEVPGLFWKGPVPFILGPLGGGQQAPPGLLNYFGWGGFMEKMRSLRIRYAARKQSVRSALEAARAVLWANEETQKLLGKHVRGLQMEMIDVGVRIGPLPEEEQKAGPYSCLYLGRLEDRKGIRFLWEVACLILETNTDFRFEFVGDGPLYRWLEEKIERHPLRQAFSLKRGIPHREVQSLMRDSRLLLFPSLRDTSGTVVLEAMAAGLPVVALDHQGAAGMMAGNAGVLVALAPENTLTGRFASALAGLCRDGTLRQSIRRTAWSKCREQFEWRNKALKLAGLYGQVAAVQTGVEYRK